MRMYNDTYLHILKFVMKINKYRGMYRWMNICMYTRAYLYVFVEYSKELYLHRYVYSVVFSIYANINTHRCSQIITNFPNIYIYIYIYMRVRVQVYVYVYCGQYRKFKEFKSEYDPNIVQTLVVNLLSSQYTRVQGNFSVNDTVESQR